MSAFKEKKNSDAIRRLLTFFILSSEAPIYRTVQHLSSITPAAWQNISSPPPAAFTN